MADEAQVVDALIRKVIVGGDIAGMSQTFKKLGQFGDIGVNAILDAFENVGDLPKDRDYRDLDADLCGGLFAIAKADPDPLLKALKRRPEHAHHLLFVLSNTSRRGDRAEVSEAFVAFVKDKNPLIRQYAIDGLARSRNKSSMPYLLAALRDRSTWVTDAAVRGLRGMADHTAIEPLRRLAARKTLDEGSRRITTELLEILEEREQERQKKLAKKAAPKKAAKK